VAEQQDSGNQRQYERVRVTRPVKLEATLRGRFIDIMRLEMSGVTIDLSDGGFLANVDQSISPGVRCRVELAGEDGGEAKSLWGRVRRTTTGKTGFVVALEFDEPVEAAALLGGGTEAAVLELSEGDGADNGGGEPVEATDDSSDEEDATDAGAPKKKRKSRKASASKGPARKKIG